MIEPLVIKMKQFEQYIFLFEPLVQELGYFRNIFYLGLHTDISDISIFSVITFQIKK